MQGGGTEPPSGHGLILFLAPSISLVGQTLREWMANAEVPINPICVCSDRTVNKKHSEDDTSEKVVTLGAPSTTDPLTILRQFRSSQSTTVIFSTYQSIDAVIEAQHAGLPDIDLIICDEAHRTTGVFADKDTQSTFTKVHYDDSIRARKRLYMTATPRIYGEKGKADAMKASVVLCSMDDEAIYGKEFYSISFGKAVELELLSDYKVLILTTTASSVPEIIRRHWTSGGREIDADTDCKLWGCMNALAKNVAFDDTLKNTDPQPMTSAVAFSRSISVSKAVTDRFNHLARQPMCPLSVSMKHIDGSMNSMERDRLLNWLRDGKEGCRVLSNVRCLSEGVDVPALDAVMFLDSKGSLVDVVQSVGRVMRRAPGKKYGYIIIPIVVPEDQDPELALNDNDRYKVVWQVLRALRSHDERLEAEINTFNYRKGTNDPNGHIHIGTVGMDADGGAIPLLGGQYTMDDFGSMLMARLVLKVGDREYIENWARSVAEIMPDLIDRLTRICQAEEYGTKQYKPAFKRYLKGLRACVNDNVPESQAVDMLAQQIITKPIFEKLFARDGFVMQNSVSGYIDKMLDEIDAKNGLKDLQEKLDSFYRSVELTLHGIDTTEGKQKVITALYEKFFKNAFPKDQSINGVVYTPQEIVDFIIRSCSDVLEKEFGRRIGDEGVNILDPFTGTGTFIARLMESGLISKEDLERKYRKELFCNEITLLAYYIAIVNIENTYSRITGSEEYVPFEHALLTDTFNIEAICNARTEQAKLPGEEEYFKKNKARIREEHSTQFTIVMGNPPYGGRQKSANDDAKKRRYESGIDKRVRDTYLNEAHFLNGMGNVNSVYDNYVRAFRWASDRIGDNDGIISFVTPNGWLTGSAFEGFRKVIEREFSKIYIFNLRGDKGSTDEMRRVEGRNVFEYSSDRGGCTVGIAITMLVRKKGASLGATISYMDMADYGDRLKGFEKRNQINAMQSFLVAESAGSMKTLQPKENGDWIVERNTVFPTLVPIADDSGKKFEKYNGCSFFVGHSLGYATHRDAWCYNFSESKIQIIKQSMVQSYNEQLSIGSIDLTDMSVKWTVPLKKQFNNKIRIQNIDLTTKAYYRPFIKKWFDNDNSLNEALYQMPRIYPDGAENLTICVAGVGVKKPFSCLMTNTHTDLEIVGKSQCFPLYWYEDRGSSKRAKNQSALFDSDEGLIRHDGISDWILGQARAKYGPDVTKEDIFYYVYGYLHSPDYRSAFSDDLKLSLPRIGLVDSVEDFKAFMEAGRRLADLHLNYESTEPCRDVRINNDVPLEKIVSMTDLHRVTKMRLNQDERKLVYNEHITITDIPEDAFRYVVNGRSALGWIVDQYQYSVDKESGIVNDPNEYAGSTYILNLVLSVITVSVETMRIVDSLPKMSFSDVSDGERSRVGWLCSFEAESPFVGVSFGQDNESGHEETRRVSDSFDGS